MMRLLLIALLFALGADACEGFKQLITHVDPKYPRDRYYGAEHLEKFWTIHRRFGVVRHGGRLLLIAHDEVTAQQLVNDLRQFSGKWANVPKVPLNGWGVAFDITDISSRLMGDLAERFGEDGPNCWNLCLRQTGISAGANYVDGPDFKHWLDSPLAKKITRVEDLRPGDVIAFRKRKVNGDVREAHGAIFVSPRILFSKNGLNYNDGYRIADINENYNIAADWSNEVDAFRITPMSEYIANNAHFLPPLVAQTARAIEKFERALTPLYIDESGARRSFNVSDLRSLKYSEGERLRDLAKAQMANPVGVERLTADERAVVDMLWKGFYLRIESIAFSGY